MVPMGVVISVMLLFEHVQVNLYTGALFIQQSLGWDLYLSILLQIGIVAVLTITGAATAIHPSVHVSIHLSVSLNTSLSVSEFADLSMVHCLPPHNCLEIRTIDRVLQVALTR